MTTYLPGHPDLDGEPCPGDCYCGCRYDAHLDDDTCTLCGCNEYVEHLAVLATRDTLDADDALDGERRRTDNLAAAVELERRARRRTLRLMAGGAA